MPRKTELLTQTQQSGVEPFTTLVSPVRRCLSREAYAFRTARQINSMELGVLHPAQYRTVCDRTQQSVKLAKSDITAAARLSRLMDSEETEYKWISVHIPVRFALKNDAGKVVEEILKAEKIDESSKICLELPADALFEDIDKIAISLKDFKLLGLTTALAAFGDEFCPVNRLYGLPVDVCMFDKSVTEKMETSAGPRSIAAMLSYVRGNETDSVICAEGGKIDPDKYLQAGFTGFTAWEGSEKGWMTWEAYKKQREGM